MTGPYSSPPCPNLRCSGTGLVPKKSGKRRMITHFSVPAAHSINDGISPEDYPLQYATVDDAIALIKQRSPDGYN